MQRKGKNGALDIKCGEMVVKSQWTSVQFKKNNSVTLSEVQLFFTKLLKFKK